jgi:endonuclease/exonuclease/phosphatase family metal-dependent hydrolase
MFFDCAQPDSRLITGSLSEARSSMPMHRPMLDHVLAPVTLVMVCLTLQGACDPFHTEFALEEPAQHYEARQKTQAPNVAASVSVMNWNIKFGGGRLDFFFDCHGIRGLMSRDEVIEHLDQLVGKIRAVEPDILILQEVDVASKRSDYIDMVQYLLDHTDLNEGVYASQWRADFVPSDGIGKIDSGNAILSRWPIDEATRIALPLVGEYDDLKRYFYLKRNVLRAKVRLPGQEAFYVVASHAEAYAQDGTKKVHIDRFKEVLDNLASEGAVFVAGADLNALPPGTQTLSEFPDSVCVDEAFIADDYSEETDWLTELYDSYPSAIPLSSYQSDNAAHFTHTTDKDGFWNRKLDFLFTNADFLTGSGLTHQGNGAGEVETMPLSDHCPISATMMLSP